MISPLHCMLLLSTTANADQYSLISDWLDDTSSLKNVLPPLTLNTLFIAVCRKRAIYCNERRLVKQCR